MSIPAQCLPLRYPSFSFPSPGFRFVCVCVEGLSGTPELCVFFDRGGLVASTVVSRMFRSLERSCPKWEIWPQD